MKNKIIKKKKKKNEEIAGGEGETADKKFSSNGSLLSLNGLKSAYSEPDMVQQQHANGANGANGEEYVHIGGGGELRELLKLFCWRDVSFIFASWRQFMKEMSDKGSHVHLFIFKGILWFFVRLSWIILCCGVTLL